MLIAYDRDDAGEAAAEKLHPQLSAEGLECFRVQFPKGMDANEYALKLTPASKSLDLVVRKAMWLGRGEPPTRAAMVETQEAAKEKTVVAPVPPPPAAVEPPSLEPLPSLAAVPVAADPEPSPAQVVPPLPRESPPAEVTVGEIVITLGDQGGGVTACGAWRRIWALMR